MSAMPSGTTAMPHVNGVVLAYPQESLTGDELRQRACSELLRQEAIRQGLLCAEDPQPMGGTMTDAAAEAIERLLDQALHLDDPSEEECRRYFEGRAARFAVGERVRARHILFAVTPQVDVNALRGRAEALWLMLRSQEDPGAPQASRFADEARQWSNCPSGAAGGDLGWLTSADCMPEFAAEVFGRQEVGVVPRLVRTRMGFHVVEILAREPGHQPTFESVRAAVGLALRQQAFANALQQYLRSLVCVAQTAGIRWDP